MNGAAREPRRHRWNRSRRAPVLITDQAGDRPARGRDSVTPSTPPCGSRLEELMSQSMPTFGPSTLLSQPIESTVQLWIRIWQAQLIARSR